MKKDLKQFEVGNISTPTNREYFTYDLNAVTNAVT